MKKLKTRGSSLLEIIVGTAIMLIVFVGFLGALKLGTKLSIDNKARIGAIALANERMEYLRSLDYDDLGTSGGIPSGPIAQTETVILNNIHYIRRTFIQYVDDPKDGQGNDDVNSITADYKRARVEVNWFNHDKMRKVVIVSNFSPNGMETLSTGGTLAISVYDADVEAVASAEVHIVNSTVNPNVDVTAYTNSSGQVFLPGAEPASNYKITVTKSDFSTDKTYDLDENNQNPNPGHLTVTTGNTTSKSFFIDELSDLTIFTKKIIEDSSWSDTFSDSSKIDNLTNTRIVSEHIELNKDNGDYLANGSVLSSAVSPDYLHKWTEISWNDSRPAGTNIKYHVYNNSTLIPDSDLPNNSTGFTNSPIDISNIATSTYNSLQLYAELSTNSTTTSPNLEDWSVSYKAGPTPLPNIAFYMHSNKTIGEKSGNPIYKNTVTDTTDTNGQKTINDMEWDQYEFSLSGSSYDIAEACPPLPIIITAGEDKNVNLILDNHSNNTLLVDVRDTSGQLLENADVRLQKTSYDKTVKTSTCGQSFFRDLTQAVYTVTASKNGYETASQNISINGQTTASFNLNAN